uniref:Inositol-1-monophosphatase n=1 Tax=Auxenochlorella protothecoides TaxID=3075 RepID=A0A1D2A1M2_AUXPR
MAASAGLTPALTVPAAARLRLALPRRARGRRTICCAAPIPRETLLEVARNAAKAGAAVVLANADKPRIIKHKGTTDLVTDTDSASEEAVLQAITRAYPDHGILGEEGGVMGDVTSDYLWCVDPLDGTTNFAHGYPSFAVSVGVLRHAVPVAGVVIEFTGGPGGWITRTYEAARDMGATCDGRPISVSRVKVLEQSLLVTGFGYDHDECWAANMDLFRALTDVTQGVRREGAAAVDLCHLAAGLVDGYWEFRLKPWDMAAGLLIAEEAGATATTMGNGALSVFDRSLLVTNGFVHEQLLALTDPKVSALLEAGVDLSQWFVPEGFKLHTGARLA